MASLIDRLVGHQNQKQWLFQQYQGERLPSTLIFHGPQGVGKKFLAQSFVQVMNCQQSDWACGQCSSCLRALDDQNEFIYNLHPDGKKSIGVDQVRQLHGFLNLKSMTRARFVIIEPADLLSLSAANSLLKVLEEAPERTHFILITDKMKSLLPTIRSRSHILKFQSLKQEELLQHKQFDSLSLEWADGRLQMALDLEDQKKVERLNESLRFLYSLLSEAPQVWKKQVPWFFDDEQARDFNFSIWKQALHKRLHGQGQNLDWLPQQGGSLARIHERIELLKADIQANVDKVLAVETCYYDLQALEVS